MLQNNATRLTIVLRLAASQLLKSRPSVDTVEVGLHTSSFFPRGEQLDKTATQRRTEGEAGLPHQADREDTLVLLPSTLDSLYTLCTMNCGRRQASNSPLNEKMFVYCGKRVSRCISTTPKFLAVKRIEDALSIKRQSHDTSPIVWAP